MANDYELNEQTDEAYTLIPFTYSHNKNTVDLGEYLLLEEEGVLPSISMDGSYNGVPSIQQQSMIFALMHTAHFIALSTLSHEDAPSFQEFFAPDGEFFNILRNDIYNIAGLFDQPVASALSEIWNYIQGINIRDEESKHVAKYFGSYTILAGYVELILIKKFGKRRK